MLKSMNQDNPALSKITFDGVKKSPCRRHFNSVLAVVNDVLIMEKLFAEAAKDCQVVCDSVNNA